MSILFVFCHEDDSNDYIDYSAPLTGFGLHGRCYSHTACQTSLLHIEILGEEHPSLARRHSF